MFYFEMIIDIWRSFILAMVVYIGFWLGSYCAIMHKIKKVSEKKKSEKE